MKKNTVIFNIVLFSILVFSQLLLLFIHINIFNLKRYFNLSFFISISILIFILYLYIFLKFLFFLLNEIKLKQNKESFTTLLNDIKKYYKNITIDDIINKLYILNFINDKYIITDKNGLILSISDNLNFLISDIKSKKSSIKIFNIFPDFLDYYNDLMSYRKYIKIEKNIYNSDYEISINPLIDINNNVEKVFIIFKDIHERKQIERWLRESKELYSKLISIIPDSIFLLDTDGNINFVSDNTLQLFGYNNSKELIGHNFFDIIITQDKTNDCWDVNYIINKERIKCSNVFYRKDKSEFIGDGFATIIKDEYGKVNGIVIIIRDITELINNQRKIEESQKKYQTIFENSIDGIVIFDKNSIYMVNNSLLKILGYENKNELINKNFLSLLTERDRNFLIRFGIENEEFASEKPLSFEVNFLCKDNTEKIIELLITRIEIEGKFYKLGIIRDITEKKKLEKALKESEEKFRQFYENAPLSFLSLDSNGYILDVNLAWLETFKYARKDVIGKWFGAFINSEDAKRFRQDYEDFVKLGEVHGLEYKVNLSNGEYTLVSLDGKVIRDNKGKFKQGNFILYNITEKKKFEMSLKESERKFKNMFETNSAIMLLVDEESNIIDANDAAKKFYQYPRERLKMMNLKKDLTLSIENSSKINKNLILRQKNSFGEEKFVEAYITPIEYEGKRIFFYIIHDITEKKKAEEEVQNLHLMLMEKVGDEMVKSREKDVLLLLQSKQASMGELINYIEERWALSLNSFYNDIQNIVQNYNKYQHTERFLLERIKNLKDLIKEITDLFYEFKNYFNIPHVIQNYSPAEIIEKALNIIKYNFKSYGIDISFEKTENITILGFPDEFSQFFINIMNNIKEVKKLNNRDKVEIKIKLSLIKHIVGENIKSNLLLYISDDAGLIPDKILKSIVDPYYTIKQFESGIGLYLAKTIVEKRLHGNFKIENSELGTNYLIEFGSL